MRISPRLCGMITMAIATSATAGFTRTIMVTGYWPPTNEMLRRFSQNPAQNSQGWIGGNWEGRGYNIVSYFPEFPGGVNANPRGTGDFQVDYQSASADFWRITSEIKPCAIITFSRGSNGSSWELESRAHKLPLDAWAPDYSAPFRPTSDLPIASEPDYNIRYSSLPMTSIRDAVAATLPTVNSFIDTSDSFGGDFVSEFTSYHSSWYANLHSSADDPAQCFAGGHIHVGVNTPSILAGIGAKVTLRTLTTYLDTVVPAPSSLTVFGGLFLLRRRRGN